jgi:hypothetical protein
MLVPAVAVGALRHALLELSDEVSEETGGAVITLAREGAPACAPVPPLEERWWANASCYVGHELLTNDGRVGGVLWEEVLLNCA